MSRKDYVLITSAIRNTYDSYNTDSPTIPAHGVNAPI